VITPDEASSASTMPGLVNAAPTSAFDMANQTGTEIELPYARAEGDLRETFDLPLGSTRVAEQGQSPGVADAGGLFADPGPSRKRTSAAEARGRARRCLRCGGVVPQGMSICASCGTDQETGMRVGLEDDLALPPPPPPAGPPIHVATIGGLCIAASLVLVTMAVIGSFRGVSSPEHWGWLCLAVIAIFGIYAAVQFIRGKTAKLLLIAISIGAAVDVMALIALPIVQANFEDADKIITMIRPEDPEDSNMRIKPVEDRIDASRISVGIAIILLYAALSLYLISEPVKKYVQERR
jgi:hypothetical protein